jgi:FkbM family methyltransferase
MLAAFFRTLLYPLITFRPTYLLGMVFVRLARKLKRRTWKEHEELVTINNFMGSIKMSLDKNSYMGGTIYWCGFHHISELLFLKSFLKPDMVFADIGANQGEFSLFAASVLKKGRVLAFEPTQHQLGLLQNNIALNQFENIEVYPYGLFDKEEKLEIFTSENRSLHAGKHEGLSSVYRSDERQISEGFIDLKVFDTEFAEQLDRLDAVKIDVEGAEFPVLKGMRSTLEKFKPVLIIEMNGETFEQAGYSLDEVSGYLDQLGYIPNRLFRGRIYSMEGSEYPEYSNVVFVHRNQHNQS